MIIMFIITIVVTYHRKSSTEMISKDGKKTRNDNNIYGNNNINIAYTKNK